MELVVFFSTRFETNSSPPPQAKSLGIKCFEHTLAFWWITKLMPGSCQIFAIHCCTLLASPSQDFLTVYSFSLFTTSSSFDKLSSTSNTVPAGHYSVPYIRIIPQIAAVILFCDIIWNTVHTTFTMHICGLLSHNSR